MNVMKIEVKCSCGVVSKLKLECKSFLCLCGVTYERTGPPPGTWKKVKKAKYNNKIVWMDGHKFDSQLEADYYVYLKQLKDSGIVSSFRLQPNYILLDGTTRNDRVEYVADFFVTYSDGREEIIDTKSRGTETKEFKIKRKWFHSKYPQLILKIMFREHGLWISDIELKAAEKLRKQAEKALIKRGVSGTHESQSKRSKIN